MANPLDEIASKTMGATKAVKATLQGLTGVFRTLEIEHGEVTALLLHVKNSNDPNVRAQLFPKIRQELLAHEKGELSVVYPAFRMYAETRSIAEQHEREASQLEQMINRVSALSVRDEAWKPSFDALVDLVQQHVHEEESDFFPKGQRMLGAEADALKSQYETAKSAVMKQVS